MKRRCLPAAILAFALMLSAAAAAEAFCLKEGYLVHIGGTKGSAASTFGVKTSLASTVRWDFWTDKTWMLSTLPAAMYSAGSGKKVKIQGNAASCPTSGSSRFGGEINYFFINYPSLSISGSRVREER
jgi:hypothetical protein